jgi:hypothetical protein
VEYVPTDEAVMHQLWRSGDAFLSGLGDLMLVADEAQRLRIKMTWPRVWGEYTVKARDQGPLPAARPWVRVLPARD